MDHCMVANVMVRGMANVRMISRSRKGWWLARVCSVYPAWRVLRSAFNGERRTTRVRRAATHNCVSTRNVCGQLDNVMNVDIFPNADITYDPSPRSPRAIAPPPPFIITPCCPFAMMYGDTRSPLCVGDGEDARRYVVYGST